MCMFDIAFIKKMTTKLANVGFFLYLCMILRTNVRSYAQAKPTNAYINTKLYYYDDN